MNLSPSHLIVWQFGHGRPLLLGRCPQQCVHRVKDHSVQRGRARGSSPARGGSLAPIPALPTLSLCSQQKWPQHM